MQSEMIPFELKIFSYIYECGRILTPILALAWFVYALWLLIRSNRWFRLWLLLFSWVPLSGIIRNETRGKPFASYARSMLLPLALLLFLTGAVLRPLLDYEINYYWQRDTLFRNGKHDAAVENRAHDYLSAKLKMFMQGHSDAFSPGKEAGQ